MTHQTMKYPLGNVYHEVMLQVLFIAAWLGIDRLIVKKTAKTHTGAGLLLMGRDALWAQPDLAAALGSSDLAIIVQKIHEWISYNQAENKLSHRRAGKWWTYNSYQEWIDKHFFWLNHASMGRSVRALEKMGVLITMQGNTRDKRKWYTLDYAQINALVAALPLKAGFKNESSRFGSESSGFISESTRFKNESHTSSKQASKSKIKTQVSAAPMPTPDAAREPQPSPLTEKETTAEHPPLDASASAQERTATASLTSSEVPLSQEGAGIDTPVSKTMTAGDLWGVARHQLCAQDETFKRWLKDAQLRAYTLVDGIGIYKVAVADDHAQASLQRRYYRNIESVFRGLINRPVRIEFEVGR